MTEARLAFTICASNYLGKALALLKSMDRHSTEYAFKIILIDEMPAVAAVRDIEDRVISLSSIPIPGLEEMRRAYDVVEFSTAIKPFCCEFLFAQEADCQELLYLDPDTYVFNPLGPIEEALREADIVLTPHLIHPVEDSANTAELRIAPSGPYNLGFIGLRRSDNTARFLRWWGQKLRQHCRCDHKLGLFYDQNWVTYAPVYFDSVKSLKHPGLNMAVWNLGERTLRDSPAGLMVNESYPLIFFHFSQFNRRADVVAAQLPLQAWGVETIAGSGLQKACDEYKSVLQESQVEAFEEIPYPRVHKSLFSYYLSVAFGRSFKWLAKHMPTEFRSLIRRQIQGI